MFKTIIKLAIIFCGLMSFTHGALASAAEPVAFVFKLEGGAHVTHNDKKSALKVDDALYAKDTIYTDAKSKIKLVYIDETEMVVAENAVLMIKDYVFDQKKPENNKALFSFMKGGFSYASGLIAKETVDSVKIQTMFGSIGIRGTKVWGGMLDKECRIYVEDGEIDVYNDFGKVHLKHGEGTRIKEANISPTPAGVWKEKAIVWIKGQVAFKE